MTGGRASELSVQTRSREKSDREECSEADTGCETKQLLVRERYVLLGVCDVATEQHRLTI